MRRLTIASCFVVSTLDVVQVVSHGWEARLFGAVAGAVLYWVAGLLLARGRRQAVWIPRLIPIIPATIILLWSANVSLPTTPNTWMIVIFAVQLVAAFGAWAWREPQVPIEA